MKKETTGTVKDGKILLPGTVRLPEGTEVRVLWDEESREEPIERDSLDKSDVLNDIGWATGKRFQK